MHRSDARIGISRLAETRSELIALLLASLACVVVLTVSIVESRAFDGPATVPWVLVSVIAIGLLAIGASAIFVARRARIEAKAAAADSDALRRELFMAHSVFAAEPQVLLFWEAEHGFRVITHALHTVSGVPQDAPTVLQFGAWLDDRSSGDLTAGLNALFEDGRPFNLLLKTKAGGHVEADARAAGSRAVLRFRDVAGYKRDLVEVLDQHRHLTRDIKTSRSLLNALVMPVWIRDGSGRLEWVNDAYVRAVESGSAEDVISEQVELLDARQRDLVANNLSKRDPLMKRMQLLVGGKLKAHDVLTVPIDGIEAAAAIDVAELESAQGELERQMSAYDRTLDRVASAVAIFNKDMKLAFYNEAYRKLWELDPDWLDQQPTDSQVLDRLRQLSRLPSAGRYQDWKQEVLEVYTTKPVYEDHWALPDGRILHVVAEQRPDGGVTYLFDDQSEQLALESQYKTLIQVQRETLDSLAEGVAVFGTDARLRLFNSAFTEIWKQSHRALAQRPHIDELVDQLAKGESEGRVWARITAAVTSLSGEQKAIEGQIVRDDGIFIDFATTPLPDGGTLATFVDVTTTQNYQRALLERNEALVAADRLKSRFISHVSYELRTPLTNIIGFSELLESPRTGDLNIKQREYLGDISASSRTLLAIIDDILDLATIDAGALELRLEPIDVRAVIDEAVETISERAARMRITLELAVDAAIGKADADPQRVRQILYNLLSNAVGFSNPGDTVRLACWPEPGTLVFEITDQGIGIPPEEQSDIFERFVSRSQGSKHRGAGLGLSIVKSLVDLHGGAISLASEPNVGTSVTVRLPTSPRARRQEATLSQHRAAASLGSEPAPQRLLNRERA